MKAGAWGVIGVNSHIPNIFLNVGLAKKGEVDSIEENQEHQNKKNITIWQVQQQRELFINVRNIKKNV
jgi:hypothetical protein